MPTDPANLGRWFELYAAPLVLYARQWCVDRGAAEDLVQEVFLRLVDQSRPPDNAKAWLFRAVRNAAVSDMRTRRRRADRERRVARQRPDWFVPDPAGLVDAAAAQDALSRLPEAQREVILLRLWGQMTLQEVSDTVGVPVSTVHDQYRAALAAVRNQMTSPCRTTNTDNPTND